VKKYRFNFFRVYSSRPMIPKIWKDVYFPSSSVVVYSIQWCSFVITLTIDRAGWMK